MKRPENGKSVTAMRALPISEQKHYILAETTDGEIKHYEVKRETASEIVTREGYHIPVKQVLKDRPTVMQIRSVLELAEREKAELEKYRDNVRIWRRVFKDSLDIPAKGKKQ